ncbi:MAG TPA: asparagine synthase (glutamine-hydrolyzing), partial [Puia sp.]|nr:asparagine synthase (glutamine-hydrolyzing) [Puia sp.]
IIHNGEIYNYIELKKELSIRGYSFQSQSDTEVILAAYDYYKEECLQHFDGMFAFAIWDEKEQTLFCARDRFGEKPFFYSFTNEQFAFASEAKAIWANGVEKKTNYPLLLNYLVLGHTHTAADNTITFFQDIFSLPASHYLKFNLPDFSFSISRYWDCDKETKVPISEKDAVEKFNELFITSVKRRLRSDVSLGTSLSGGLDSSSIISAISKIQGTNSLQTFSAVFPGFEKDESKYIQAVTEKFGLKNYSVIPTAEDLIKDIERICYHQEIPFTSSGIFAQYKVFELAKQQNVKVLLDGQGADETLAGYNKYIHWYLQELLSARSLKFYREKSALRKNKIPFNWNLKNNIAAWFPAQATYRLEKRETKKLSHFSDITDDFKNEYLDKQSIHKPIVFKLNDILYFNTFQSGLEELLRYADRNSMAYGREVRLPFLDHELVQFIFSLPSHFKIHKGYTKWLLRESMKENLPDAIVWRKEKVGFEPPQKKWMENSLLQKYIRDAKTKLVKDGILNPSALNKKIQPHNAYAAENFDWRYLVASKCMD